MKVLKNQTGSAIQIIDTGVTLPASPTTFTIPEQDYLIWAASLNILTQLASGDVILSDGIEDCSKEFAKDFIRYPDDDSLTSYENLVSARTKTIPQGRQMIVHGVLNIIGAVNIEGALILIG